MSDIIVTAVVALAAMALIIALAGLIIDVVASVRERAERRRQQWRERQPWTAAIRTERTRGGFP